MKIWAFLLRDWRSWGSYRFSVLLQMASMMFVLMVFFFISTAVTLRESSSVERYADNYFDFVVVGLAITGYVTVSLSGFASRIRDSQISGTLEALLVTPTSIPTLVAGSTAWDYLSATGRFFGLLWLASAFFGVPIIWSSFPVAIGVLALTVIAFSGIGLLSAAFVMVFKRGDPVAQAVAWFSMLLGGVYFPTAAVGEPTIEAAAQWLPLTPALHSLRLLLLRNVTLAEISPDLLRLSAMAAVLLPLGLAAFAFGVRRARHTGSLTHY